MSNRELVILGTASQAPTRTRNHNGYFLRWDDEGLLFDPGEGTQRQMLFAGVTAHQITRGCVTHFHGDHCLGLPGVLQRMALDQVTATVEVAYPASREPTALIRTSVLLEMGVRGGAHPQERVPISCLLGDVLEAYERLILDAMRNDHTLFTTAEGIERLWEISVPLLEAPPPVRLYPQDSWGPKSVHQLIAPNAWRLPFERAWRDPNKTGS